MTEVLVTWLRHRVYARGPTWLEVARAHAVEVEDANRRAGVRDRHGFRQGDSLETRAAGFAAEIAVALYTGLPWNRDDPFATHDVGVDVEVKNRKQRYAEYLVIAEGEARRDRRYVITYGRDPELRLVGWAYGEHVLELPVREFHGDQSHGYAAPAEWLLPMDTFPEVVRAVRGSPRQSSSTRGLERRDEG